MARYQHDTIVLLLNGYEITQELIHEVLAVGAFLRVVATKVAR